MISASLAVSVVTRTGPSYHAIRNFLPIETFLFISLSLTSSVACLSTHPMSSIKFDVSFMWGELYLVLPFTWH